jgi:methyl-accepting chemotaxis protein
MTMKEFYTPEEVAELQAQLLQKQQVMEARMWVDALLGKFDDILRNLYDKSVEEFADAIIFEVAKISEALRGVFYNLDNNQLQAVAGYACTVNSLHKSTFEIGEGLIGQAVKSKECIYWDNLPPQNLTVTSSAGQISAKAVMVLPLMFNEKVYGVIELLFIKPLNEKYKELLNRLGRNIATMLQSIQTSTKTKALLRESMLQAEALRAAEEELRQNMEELQATQEEIQRVNAEMLLQNKAVEETLLVIELLPNGKIVRCCNLYCNYTGYSQEELQNTNYIDIIKDEAEKEEFAFTIHGFVNKNIIQKQVKRHKKDGTIFWLQATYYAVKDSKGQIQRIIKIAYDISDTIQLKSVMEENEKILKERVKIVQNKGFEQLKKIREKYEAQLAEKDAYIQTLLQQMPPK